MIKELKDEYFLFIITICRVLYRVISFRNIENRNERLNIESNKLWVFLSDGALTNISDQLPFESNYD